jgi:hypothetical protein
MLPLFDPALIPSDVRSGGPQAQQRYAAALGLEREFLQQLTDALAQSAQPQEDDGSDGDGTDAGSGMGGSNPYAQLLPGALADGLTAAGGTGLADDLYRAITLSSAPADSAKPGQAS